MRSMTGQNGSIFLDFQLPNATTWSYFSFLLSVALFFKFRRLISFRNWDILSAFLLVPGLLLIQEANLKGDGDSRLRWVGYMWLLGGSGYFFVRCLIDLALVRRPALAPNLSPGGLTWLAATLFICLVSVAARSPQGSPSETVGKRSVVIEEVEKRVETAARDVGARDTEFWVHRILAVLCHAAVVAGLIMIGVRHFQDVHGGIAAATFYLLLPYTALYVGQLHHIWPIAFLLWAIALYRRPTVAGVLVGVATGGAYFPVVTLPIWISFYWRRGGSRFVATFFGAGGMSLLAAIGLLWIRGELQSSVRAALDMADWQAWKAPTTEGFWIGIPWPYRLPVFVAYVAFILTTAFWPMPKTVAHVLALSAANLIGIQFWYADQGGVYILWYLPFLVLIFFRPNLSDRLPPLAPAEATRAGNAARWLGRWTLRQIRGPEPVARVK
jgi:hypothetical protein